MVAINKNMDIFGVCILGLSTAVGGGIIRDIILDNTPPVTFREPVYAIVSILTCIIIFLPSVRKFLASRQRFYDISLNFMDSLGLSIFTVVGMQTAYQFGETPNYFLMLFVGVVTGIGGGILRDLFAATMPFVFTKHFYATASLIGAICMIILLQFIPLFYAMLISSVIILLLRCMASQFHWELPTAEKV